MVQILRGYSYRVIFLVFLFICATSFGQEAVDTSRIVRVLSYNILHGATLNNDFDLRRIADVIQKVSPDVVALQEVDFKTRRARGVDQATELGHLTGLSPLFGKAMTYDGGEYGEAILSRYSFKATKNNPLPHSPRHEPRTALEALIELPCGEAFVFIGTHLDHTKDPTDRIAQAKMMNRLFAHNTVPTILAGDLNATPQSDPIRILTEHWTDAHAGHPQATYPSSHPNRRIDYIMFMPAHRWRVIETQVLDDKIASEHCALLAVLELLPEKRGDKKMKEPDSSQRVEQKVYSVHKVPDTPIVLDGSLNEPSWQAARLENEFRFPWQTREVPLTEFRAFHNDKHLYFGFRVWDDDLVIAQAFEDKTTVVREDRVELFFACDEPLQRYYCLEMDPLGRVYDYAASYYRQFDPAWEMEGLTVAGRTTPEGYIVEGAIPLKTMQALGLFLKGPEPTLRVGVFRGEFSHGPNNQIEEDWISWIDPKTKTPDFHVPEAFGWFRLKNYAPEK